jgi:small-conductance mechanosensitive channel
MKKIALILLICASSIFAHILNSDFLKIEKDRLIITDESKFLGYLKSLDDGQIIAEYKSILTPINLSGDADEELANVSSYEQAFKNLRLIYSKLYLKEKPENIDKNYAKLQERQAKTVALLLSAQNKNLYDVDIIPIIFEYRKIDRKLLELSVQKESLYKTKLALIDTIIKKNLRFENDDIDLKAKITDVQDRLKEMKKESEKSKSAAKNEQIVLKSAILSFKLKSYEMRSDFFEKIRLLKKVKSSKDSDKDKQILDSLLSKKYEPILFSGKEALPENRELFGEYQKEKELFTLVLSQTQLDSQVFERVFKSFDESLPAKTTGALEAMYESVQETLNVSLFVSNNSEIKIKTVIFVMFCVVLIYILKSWLAAKVVPKYFERAYKDGGHSEHIRFIVSKIIGVTAYVIIFFVLMSGFGLSLTNFAIIVSALSVGIGFGLQGVVSNFISGVILLFENSIKIGDVLSMPDGRTGVVTSVNLRTTNIKTADDVVILIPNSNIFSGQIENLTKESSIVRKRVKFSVGYESDLTKLKEVLDAKTKELLGDNFMEPTQLLVIGYGNYGIEIEYRVFVDLKRGMTEVGDFLKEFLVVIKENGIELPYPKLEIIKFEGNLK